MIRTLIVDDEIWVCKLIRNIVDWKELGFEIIGETYNGDEALNIIENQKPDLVLTDIRMPGRDGISIIKRTVELKLNIKFIIISGHNDFRYAQEAIKLGALGYLLKPIDKNELVDFLDSVKQVIRSDEENKKQKERMKEDLSSSLTILKQEYFKNRLDGELSETKKSLEEINYELKSDFKKGFYRIIVFNVDQKNKTEQLNDALELIFISIYKSITEKLFPACMESTSYGNGNMVVCVLNYETSAWEYLNRKFHDLFDKIVDYNIKRSEFYLTVGLGLEVEDINDLKESYSRAVKAVKARIVIGLNRIIDLSEYTFVDYKITDIISVQDEKKLCSCFEVFDHNATLVILKALFSRMESFDRLDPSKIFSAAKYIVELFFRSMERKEDNDVNRYWSRENVIQEIEKSFNIKQIRDIIMKLSVDAEASYRESKYNKNSKTIVAVKKFIDNHYNEEITLKIVSDQVSLNPKYLGEMFKKETGINFSEYLINYRMDIAKDLLKDVRSRIGEVCEMVGYNDPRHFSKIFKKYTGVTPRRYKKMFT